MIGDAPTADPLQKLGPQQHQFVFAEPLFHIFTDEPAVIEAGVYYLRIQTAVLVFMGLEIVYEGAFTGAADTMPTLWVTGVGTAVRR